MMPDTAERLAAVFNDIMREETVSPRDRTRANCLVWDSMMHLSLTIAIEEEFQVTFDPADVVDMNSFSVALDILNEKLTDQKR